MPFIVSVDLAGILGELHSTIHRTLASLLAASIVGDLSRDYILMVRRHHR